ncbi:MAG: hypothetical protein IJT34_05875 [Butyrivibrio sp.]|nr:hypothetical protein [Butyrivibrio sp.]
MRRLLKFVFIGMMATTACSPSLEGKNYWILQSLPLEKKTIYQGWRGDEVRNG